MTTFEPGVARRVAGHRVGELVRAGVLPASERDDFVQELLCLCLARWPHYDPSRSAPHTYLVRVAGSAACSLLRARFAAKRRPATRRIAQKHTDFSAVIRRLDVDHVIAALSSRLQTVCHLLRERSVAETARRLNMPRHQLLKHIDSIRQHFVAAGFEGAA